MGEADRQPNGNHRRRC